MESSTSIFTLPENIDEQIEHFVAANPAITVPRVVRDIARLHFVARTVRNGLLGKDWVLAGGMAMRCLRSTRFSVYDSDTSTNSLISNEQLTSALNYEDDDIALCHDPVDIRLGKDLTKAHPVIYKPYFTQLDAGDTTFALTVSQRGVKRPAQWLTLEPGYPFRLWAEGEDVTVPVMAQNEILAEKLCAWWIFSPAKHYADISYIGGLLLRDGRVNDNATRADIRALIELKIDQNRTVGRKHLQQIDKLDRDTLREKLLHPERHVDPTHNFGALAFVGRKPPAIEAMRQVVRRSIVPLLFD